MEKRDSLIGDVEAELKKDAHDIDGDFIDRRIDELCALEGLSPPTLDDAALDAAARTVRARAAWKHRNTQAKAARRRRLARTVIRGAVAACCLALLTFSANYLAILATDSCLLSKVGVKICCGTPFCRCAIAKAEETVPSAHSE
ncbi:MAG: hypothetical protein LBT00_15370 [Spirochaetaceae bacterium]|jgi:hypothetical protein|nr:hypothetical protein [Spirochaetaceae bacterium]